MIAGDVCEDISKIYYSGGVDRLDGWRRTADQLGGAVEQVLALLQLSCERGVVQFDTPPLTADCVAHACMHPAGATSQSCSLATLCKQSPAQAQYPRLPEKDKVRKSLTRSCFWNL